MGVGRLISGQHCVKSVQIRSFFWSVFYRIQTAYGPEKTPYLDTFHTVHYFLKSPTLVINNRGLFKLTFILIFSREIKKLLFLPRLWRFLFFDHRILYYEHKFLFMQSLFWPDRSTSSIFIFRKSFFPPRTCWQSFLRENLTVNVALFLLILRQAFMLLGGVSQPNFSNMCFPPKNLLRIHWDCLLYLYIPVLNTAHVWSSIFPSLLHKRKLTLFVTERSDFNFERLLFTDLHQLFVVDFTELALQR